MGFQNIIDRFKFVKSSQQLKLGTNFLIPAFWDEFSLLYRF